MTVPQSPRATLTPVWVPVSWIAVAIIAGVVGLMRWSPSGRDATAVPAVAAVSDAPPVSDPAPGPTTAPVVAEMLTRACYGGCPAYQVTVHADGTVRYCGERSVKVGGEVFARLSPDELAALERAFDDAGFATAKRRYESAISTCGASPVYLRHGDTEVTINGVGRIVHEPTEVTYIEGPEALEILQVRFKQLVGLTQWTGTRDELNAQATRAWNRGECGIAERWRTFPRP